jgi:hypothetical protein
MHTAMVLIAGFALLGAGLVIARIIGKGRPNYDPRIMASAAKAFIPVWFALALVNSWVGVVQAGYPVLTEAATFTLVFLLPAAAAYFVWQKFASAPRQAGA